MELDETRWCSWCHNKTTHRLIKRNYLTRNEFKCSACNNYTVQCRFCKNMATNKSFAKKNGSFSRSLKDNWANELCAEHNGTIANFEKLNHRLNDLKDYEILFKNSKWDIARTGKITVGIVAGSAVFGPLAYIAAPGMASALGLSGALRTIGTNSIIRSLGSTAILTATGIAIGATQGGVISNNYFGAVKNWVELQDEYDCLYGVVDYHAITIPQNYQKVRTNTWDLITNLVSVGIKPENIFVVEY